MKHQPNELTADEPLDDLCRIGDKAGRKGSGRRCDVCGCQLYVDESPYRCQDCVGVVQASPSGRNKEGLLGFIDAQPSPPRIRRVRSWRADL